MRKHRAVPRPEATVARARALASRSEPSAPPEVQQRASRHRVSCVGAWRRPTLLLELLWLALAALTPSIFNPASVRVFEPEKIAFIRAVALLMLSLWALEALPGFQRSTLPNTKKRERRFGDTPSPARPQTGQRAGLRALDPLSSLFLLPVGVLMGAYLLAALLSESPTTGLLGSYRRQLGAVTYLALGAVFLTVAFHLRTGAQARRLLLAIALGSVVPSLYAVAQKLGLDPFPWLVGGSYRVGGTLGLSTHLGALLAAAMPATLCLPALPASRLSRAVLALLLLLQLAALLFSGTRSSWLGGAAGIAVVLLALAAGHGRLRRRLLPAAAIGSLACLGILILLNLPGTEVNRFARSVPYLERVARLTELGAGTGSARFVIWRTSLSMLPERPMLGYGPDMMGYGFERCYPPEFAYLGNRTSSVDFPHNVVLQQLITTGVVGLGAFLWLLTSVFRGLLPRVFPGPQRDGKPTAGDGTTKAGRHEGSGRFPGILGWLRVPAVPGQPFSTEERVVGIAALGGIVAGLGDGLAGVPSASASLLLWLYLALAAATVRGYEPAAGPGAAAPLPALAPRGGNGRRLHRERQSGGRPSPGAPEAPPPRWAPARVAHGA